MPDKIDVNVTQIMQQNPLNFLAELVHDWRKSKGFYTPSSLATENERDAMLGKLMLVTTEIAEAAEAVRHKDRDNFIEELMDTIWRIFDIAYTQGIDLDAAFWAVMAKNEKRAQKHGKETSL